MLTYETKNGWTAGMDAKAAFAFAEGYKSFITTGKTERLCCRQAVALAEEKGFRALDTVDSLKPGDKVYVVNRDKGVLLAVIGSEDMEQGIRFVIAHIDSPRLDLKQNPLYEDLELAFLKTHYYGGIKKYQWTTIPLALHGVIFTAAGERVEICIGEEPGDPVFTVTDLLPHLSDEQAMKKTKDAISGEALNLLAGSLPGAGDTDCKEKVKQNILSLLHQKYGITEEDFISAELEAVPAGAARDVGMDRALVGGYGQDDRVCAYTSLSAILATEQPAKTAVCVLVDKEEIGSMGNSGMRSAFFEYALASLLQKRTGTYNELMLKTMLHNSACLSADVSAGIDPAYPDVLEKRNAAKIGHGVVLTKYTGSRGKSGTSDANAEFVYAVRKRFCDAGVIWQTGELGKVDVGGGGTIAQYVANLDVEVLDCGVPLLSMHAPFEVASKADIYAAYQGYLAFLTQA